MESNRDDLELAKPLTFEDGDAGPEDVTKFNESTPLHPIRSLISKLSCGPTSTSSKQDPGPDGAEPDVEYINMGVFTVSYDRKSPPLFSWSDILECWALSSSVSRYLDDMWSLSKLPCFTVYLWMVAKTLVPSLLLYLGVLVILEIHGILTDRPAEILMDFRLQLVAWNLCALLSYWAEMSAPIHLRGEIGGLVRKDFLPKLVAAALHSDIGEMDGALPDDTSYGEYIPGWEEFIYIFYRVTGFFALIFQTLTMLAISSLFEDRFDVRTMLGLIAAFLSAKFLFPKNGAGGGGYTYWPTDKMYLRLMALYKIVFNDAYRASVAKDGLDEFVKEEFTRTAKELEVVKLDSWILDWNVRPPLVWGLCAYLIVHHPMELCALFRFFWSPSDNYVITIIVFLYAVFLMRTSIEPLEENGHTGSLLQNMEKLTDLYKAIDKASVERAKLLDFPGDATCAGVMIKLENVSHKYHSDPEDANFALHETSLSVQSGQLIVICGKNGSGKTTLTKIISGLVKPLSGKVFVNGVDLRTIDRTQFRQAIIVLGQSEVLYPLSIRENLLYGLPVQGGLVEYESEVRLAAEMGGADDLMDKYGAHALLNPCRITAVSLRAKPGDAAYRALDKACTRHINLSPGEKARVVASRAFMRLNNQNVKLIILDEPTSSLDAITEKRVFDKFRAISRQKGQTMIVVTHRLASVAKYADLILCMDKGRIVESGTHEDLMKDDRLPGRYRHLYNAQAFND